jgi:hypothetical protein
MLGCSREISGGATVQPQTTEGDYLLVVQLVSCIHQQGLQWVAAGYSSLSDFIQGMV